MNDYSADLISRVSRLAVRQLDEALTPDERAELIEVLRGSDAARRVYLEHMQDSVSLRWLFSGHCDRTTALTLAKHGPKALTRRRRRTVTWIAAALAAGVAAAAAWPYWRHSTLATRNSAVANAPPESAALPATIATVSNVSRVAWSKNAAPAEMLSRVKVGQQFEFSGGALTLTFDTGTQVKVFGPAKFEVKSPRWIRCSRGRVTTLVGPNGKGFTIDTPKARIVDLGTQFGVNISEAGDTQVVVFKGSVDLSRPEDASHAASGDAAKWTRRMQQGDALMLDNSGQARRLMSVQRGDFFPVSLVDALGRPRQPMILDVRDNMRDGESTKCYQIVPGGLREDAPCFVDRGHQWNGVDGKGIPDFLRGADYVMPFNADKFLPDLQVSVKVARPASCYVFLDDNMSPPAWLRREFKDTGLDIGMDSAETQWHADHRTASGPGKSIDFTFSIWRREVPKAGILTLGAVEAPQVGSRSRGFNMYGIAVVPK